VVLATIFVVVVFWDSYRLVALGTLAALFLLAGVTAWGLLMHKLRIKPKLFATSLSELTKDRQQLTSVHE
jgi:uncharacterized membrane protein YqjE